LHNVWLMAGGIFLINLPFGAWRARTRRFSGPWFLAIHIPVVISVAFRFLVGPGFVLALLPLYILAFGLGQSVGGRLA
jgi:hypothetical protein